MCWWGWQIHLSEEMLSKQVCSGCAESAFMQHGIKPRNRIGYWFCLFCICGKRKNNTCNCSFKHINSVQNFSLSFLSDVAPTRTFHVIPRLYVTSVTVSLPIIPVFKFMSSFIFPWNLCYFLLLGVSLTFSGWFMADYWFQHKALLIGFDI